MMKKTFAREPIGAGPYRLVSFQHGQQLIVEANPRYAGKRMTLTGWFCLPDEDNAYAAARSGQLGLVRIAPSMAVARSRIILNSGYAIALKTGA